MSEIIDKRPPWIEWHGVGVPPIKVGQTVERRYKDEEEQSFIVSERHFSDAIWRHHDEENDITHYRIVCDENGRPI